MISFRSNSLLQREKLNDFAALSSGAWTFSCQFRTTFRDARHKPNIRLNIAPEDALRPSPKRIRGSRFFVKSRVAVVAQMTCNSC
jgi:uncharacterized protein (DUF3084 family)